MKSLQNKYSGQAVSIVGKGPSLRYLRQDHFADGPVIALNQAILAVEMLDLSNPIYSMQKDPEQIIEMTDEGRGRFNPVCGWSPNCGDICGSKVRPRKAVLLLDMNTTGCCFSDYKPRYEFNQGALGLKWDMASFFVALRIGKYFGCDKYRIIACDAIAGKDTRTYIPDCGISGVDGNYMNQARIANDVFLPTVDHEFLTPKEHGA